MANLFVLDTVGNTHNKQKVFSSTGTVDSSSASKSSRFDELFKFRDEFFKDSTSSADLLLKYKPSLTLSSFKETPATTSILPNVTEESKQQIEKIVKKRPHFTKKEDDHSNKLALEVEKALKKAVVTPNFEELKDVPPYEVSKRKLLKQRQQEREKTKGKNWFGLPATEMTDEVQRDLEILQMRSVLDPKHFYKKNDLKVLPKYFQVGKVMDSPLDFYNNRLTKKERKRTLVDELLANAEFQQYNKRKYKEVVEEKQKTHYKSWRQAKRLKKKK